MTNINLKTVVVKLGGSVEHMPAIRASLCQQLATLTQNESLRLVVVHGGGKEINNWLGKLQKESFFKDGLRVTDSETMELVEMVLVGKVNSEIVQSLKNSGCKAVGLSGRSAGIFEANLINSSDYGFVGNVSNTNTTLIESLLSDAYIPVIAPIGGSSEFGALNINADTAAAKIAAALKADFFILLTDVDGLYSNYGDPNQELICSLTVKEASFQIENSHIAGGMIPKLESCVTAIEGGASKAIICNGAIENILLHWVHHEVGHGTQIIKEKY